MRAPFVRGSAIATCGAATAQRRKPCAWALKKRGGGVTLIIGSGGGPARRSGGGEHEARGVCNRHAPRRPCD
jgi:hypothetical protein